MDFQSPFTERLTPCQSQGRVEDSMGQGDPDFSFDSELVNVVVLEKDDDEVRVSPPRLEERVESTLSVLRPTGDLLLLVSRNVTGSWGLASC